MTDKKKELSPEELKKASGGAGFGVDPQKRGKHAADQDMSADELKRVRGGTDAGQHKPDLKDPDISKVRNRDQGKPGTARP